MRLPGNLYSKLNIYAVYPANCAVCRIFLLNWIAGFQLGSLIYDSVKDYMKRSSEKLIIDYESQIGAAN